MVRTPLSIWTYILRERRRILPAFIMIVFIVTIAIVVPSTLRGLKTGAMRFTREFDSFSVVLPKKDSSITPEQREEIRRHDSVDRVIDALNCIVRLRTLVGSLPYQLRAVDQEEMAYLMERTGLRLASGRLPAAGTGEVAMHEWLMAANGWSLGAEFGVEVNDEDWMPGRFKVVGILAGETPMGFASREFLSDDLTYSFARKLWERLIVVPKPGRHAEMNAFLRSLSGVKAYDRPRAVAEVNDTFDRIVLVTDFISGLLIVVVALVVGLLNNLFFSQRIDEFAILMAIGWTRGRLLGKVLGESLAIALSAWGLGLAAALAVLRVFGEAVLSPRGLFIPTVQALPIAASLALPAMAMIFSAATVLRRLTRLDPVLIIERRG